MTNTTAVTAMEQPKTIHDFGGFPPALYAMHIRHRVQPALAQRVAALLAPETVVLDHSWGLDHGAWSLLVKVYPNEHPVVQLSLRFESRCSISLCVGKQLFLYARRRDYADRQWQCGAQSPSITSTNPGLRLIGLNVLIKLSK